MLASSIVKGLRLAAEKAIHRMFVAPQRRRRWAKASGPFCHQTRAGLKFELYPHEYVDGFIYVFGIYERQYLDFIRDHLPEGAVALDIGANIGNHSIYLALKLAVVHAFEPNPVTFKRLQRNIRLNNLDGKVSLHPVGVGDTAGAFQFRANVAGNLGASGFLREQETLNSEEELVELPIVRADDYVAKLHLSRLDFVKVDVEGWEPSVLRGLSATIERFRPVVAFEYHGQIQPTSDFDAIRAALPDYIIAEPCFADRDLSYAKKALWAIQSGGRPALRRVAAPEQRSYENLLAFPNEEALQKFAS